MTHIGAFDKALKAKWINRIFHGKKDKGWIALFCLSNAMSIDSFKYVCRSNKKNIGSFQEKFQEPLLERGYLWLGRLVWETLWHLKKF